MPELLIVDGYNIIHAWTKERLINVSTLDMSRQQLCTLLSSCAAFWGYDLVIVYDAAGVNGGIEHCEVVSPGVRVVFSAAGVSADSVIERLVANSAVQVILATSDAAEQSYAFGKGAVRWPARELLRRVRATQRDIEEKRHTGVSSLLLHDMLSPHVKQVFNTMRLGSFPEERQTKQSVTKSKRGLKS
ncbi:MAG: NYN domain-containing protein [Bacillota bacterium]|nr:NYN domain-containing protein [Bacillota bacterium]